MNQRTLELGGRCSVGNEPKYWRIRMTFGAGGKDVTRSAWEKDIVGIWFGGWNAEEFAAAMQKSTVNEQRAYLSQSPAQSRLFSLSAKDFNTCLKFNSIASTDWVYVYFDEAFHFARVNAKMETSCSEAFNFKNAAFPDSPPELFKYRRITEKKSFKLGQLPTPFLILRSAGRSNVVHEHNDSYWILVKMLAGCSSEAEVCEKFGNLSLNEWLDLANDKTWEAISEAYLILEKDFVPVGLKVGGTLPDLDIVGCSRDGTRILAQCKKHPRPVPIEDKFVSLCATFPDPKELFYFAFGGVSQSQSSIQIVDRTLIKNWIETTVNGKLYRKLAGLDPSGAQPLAQG